MFSRRAAVRMARAEAMARISELAARVLASPTDEVLAERLSTARLLYDQATTPAALAEVTALVAETMPVPPLAPARRHARRRSRRAVPSGIRAAAHARRFRPTRLSAVVVAVRPGWWRKPAVVVGLCTSVLFSTLTSDPGADVTGHRIAITVVAVAFIAALVWLAVRARPVIASYRTRRAAVEARLNEIAAQVLHPAPATSEEVAREQAEAAKRYVLLLHSHATEPLAKLEQLLASE